MVSEGVRVVTEGLSILGESPLWNYRSRELYWVDFHGPKLHRLDADGVESNWSFDQFESVGSLAFCSDGRLLVAVDCGIFLFCPLTEEFVYFADPNGGRTGVVYNDAKVDRFGNYWVGNFDAAEEEPRGILYVLNQQGEWSVGDAGFICCNGPTFSPDGHTLFFSDSNRRRTLAYDLDRRGSLSARRIFFNFTDLDGLPDGCCVDREGCIWIAMYGGGKVVKLSPNGTILLTIELPATNVTSCCLGGRDLRTLFITSAQHFERDEPQGGALYAVDVEVPGLPEPSFSIPLGLL